MRAVTYCRYSSSAQRESSIEDQVRNCTKRALAEGWIIVGNFADKAISGSDNRRPAYLKMQEAAAAKKFDVLLLDDLSRLSRDSVEQETVIRRLEFGGIRIVASDYDSAQTGNKINRGMRGLMNELYLDDLKAKVHRGLTGVALAGRWTGSRPYGYRLKALRDAGRRDAYGEAERIGTVLVIDQTTAPTVLEIFTRFAAGESYLSIAMELNRRGIPSPGSTWKRTVRRSAGWMGSGVRGILRNEIYTGRLEWNTSQWVKDPDSKKRLSRRRPKSEWITKLDESIRIIPDELFARAQHRARALKDSDPRLKSGGKPKHLLSGLLRCESCGSNFILANANSYACSSFINGRSCDNGTLVRRDELEAVIVHPLRDGLLKPSRVAKMAKELEAEFAAYMKAGETAPRELKDLDARIARLKARLNAGDPDMTADEIQAGIDRAEAKRKELKAPPAAQAKMLAMLPAAAAAYREQIKAGLDGDPVEALKARVVLRDLVGIVRMIRDEHGLWAQWKLNPAALLKAVGTDGSGGRI